MDNIDRVLAIRQLLTEAFQPEKLDVLDESDQHIGHAHFGGGHFRVKITSHRFIGLPRVQVHQRIFDALKDLLETDIHALAIEAAGV